MAGSTWVHTTKQTPEEIWTMARKQSINMAAHRIEHAHGKSSFPIVITLPT
jgi:hypothetical protein